MTMHAWHAVTRHNPCSICDHSDWCCTSTDGTWAICRRVDTGAGLHRVDKAGADYWLYRLDGHVPWQPSLSTPAPPPQPERADPLTIDRVYSSLLAVLPLSAAHRQALRARGLDDKAVLRGRYRTMPLQGRADLARRLVDQFGGETCAQVPGIYQATRHGRQWWTLAGAPGLLVPVRDLAGHIVALKVRTDDPGTGPKYSTVSSARHGGPGPGAQVHVPLHAAAANGVVRITEGELKADVATVLSGILTLSIPGVAAWRPVLPVLESLNPRQVLLAFDSDWRTNAHVARAIGELGDHLLHTGYHLEVEDWYPTQAKGIDDLLAAGLTPTRRQSFFVYSIYFRGQCEKVAWQLPTVDVKEIPRWH
jgi:uncharacterized protein DUF3854